MSLIHLPTGEVSETGRRSFSGSWEREFLGTGQTSARFHCAEKWPSISAELKMCVNGGARSEDISFRMTIGIGSGPQDFLLLRLLSGCDTISVLSSKFPGTAKSVGSLWGFSGSYSSTTFKKVSLIISAKSIQETSRVPKVSLLGIVLLFCLSSFRVSCSSLDLNI